LQVLTNHNEPMNTQQTIQELQDQIEGMQRLIDKMKATLTKSLETIAEQHGEIIRLQRQNESLKRDN
jgi:phage shock protein A